MSFNILLSCTGKYPHMIWCGYFFHSSKKFLMIELPVLTGGGGRLLVTRRGHFSCGCHLRETGVACVVKWSVIYIVCSNMLHLRGSLW